MQANFLLGTLRITDAAQMKVKRIPYDLLARHAINEHGYLSRRETRMNEINMKSIGEIKSRYRVNPLDLSEGNILVTTREFWDETLVMLEGEE